LMSGQMCEYSPLFSSSNQLIADHFRPAERPARWGNHSLVRMADHPRSALPAALNSHPASGTKPGPTLDLFRHYTVAKL
jgi:hypothetical protein